MREQPFTFPIVYKWLRLHIELLFWLAGTSFLFFMNPDFSQPSLCLFRFLGFERCPGCGLGHSIQSAMHFSFVQSFHQHLAGIPAMLIIFLRIKQLSFPKKLTFYED